MRRRTGLVLWFRVYGLCSGNCVSSTDSPLANLLQPPYLHCIRLLTTPMINDIDRSFASLLALYLSYYAIQ
uniref:Putative secreted protein n=1 Tax=Anopheles marajoara TaxID=58244 RepID=A0A2M4CEL6_9DIPT